jgi:hypothetical protein
MVNNNVALFILLDGVPFTSNFNCFCHQQSHFLKASALRVGFPPGPIIGPGIPPMRAQNDLRRPAAFGEFFASLAETGGLR